MVGSLGMPPGMLPRSLDALQQEHRVVVQAELGGDLARRRLWQGMLAEQGGGDEGQGETGAVGQILPGQAQAGLVQDHGLGQLLVRVGDIWLCCMG